MYDIIIINGRSRGGARVGGEGGEQAPYPIFWVKKSQF